MPALLQIERPALTPAQKAQLQLYSDRWMAVRRSTAPVDRTAAEQGVVLAYRSAGLAPPTKIEWCSGPIQLARTWLETVDKNRAGPNVRHRVITQALEQAGRNVGGYRRSDWRLGIDPTRLATRDPLGTEVNDAVLNAAELFRPSVWSQFWRRTTRRWAREPQAERPPSFTQAGMSQHDSGWLALYQYLHDVCGFEQEMAKLGGLWQVAANMGWIVPHERICWISERHNILKGDAQGRLHSADGPALQYPDGWTIHAWKGVQVPGWIIQNRERITAAEIAKQRDRVIRRCMIDILSPEKYIATGDPIAMSRDETGILWKKRWQLDMWAAVEVINGTPEPDGTLKHYFLQVPADVTSAREAVAWTYGMTPAQYAKLSLRT